MNYFICSTQRSGSSLLCHLLRQTRALGRPGEIFGKPDAFRRFSLKHNLDPKSVDQVVMKLKSEWASDNGVCGFKVHYHQFLWLVEQVALAQIFPDLRFIYIDRQDVVEQAVSLMRARVTGAWSSDHSASGIAARFSDAEFYNALDFLLEEKLRWQAFFQCCDVDVLKVHYEELEKNPKAAIARVCEFLGVKCNLSAVSLEKVVIKKQRDSLSQKFVDKAKRAAKKRFFENE